MNECPFLSTENNIVLCFEECAFYDSDEDSESCPFKNLDSIENYNLKEKEE